MSPWILHWLCTSLQSRQKQSLESGAKRDEVVEDIQKVTEGKTVEIVNMNGRAAEKDTVKRVVSVYFKYSTTRGQGRPTT